MPLRAEASRLRVHQLASDTAVDCVNLVRTFRGPGALARGDQLVRAALSISSNIAEACGRGTAPEFRQFLLYARGSSQEVLSQLRIARRLDLTREILIRRMETRIVVIMKMVGRLYNHPPPDQ